MVRDIIVVLFKTGVGDMILFYAASNVVINISIFYECSHKNSALSILSPYELFTNYTTQKPPSTYHIEYAKSSRSQCKKCKEKIAKDVLRIVTSTCLDNSLYC